MWCIMHWILTKNKAWTKVNEKKSLDLEYVKSIFSKLYLIHKRKLYNFTLQKTKQYTTPNITITYI
jgi:hypothetical protein